MEAHRSRRTRDQARKAWYAYYRQVRFARWFGVIEDANLGRAFLDLASTARPELTVPRPISGPQMNASC
jgi:hypothetical protein